MTYSTVNQATLSNISAKNDGSSQATSGLHNNDMTKNRTFMQKYREYYQFLLRGKFGNQRSSQSALAVSRYGLSTVLLFERYDELLHRQLNCNVNQRINMRSAAIKKLKNNWPMKRLELNKMWRTWEFKKV